MSNGVMACPLCGDSGFIKVATRCKPEGEWEARMKCEECGIELIKSGETEDAAITALLKAWNTRAERMCTNVYAGREFECSECGMQWHLLDREDEMEEWAHVRKPSYCPSCGAKVVK